MDDLNNISHEPTEIFALDLSDHNTEWVTRAEHWERKIEAKSVRLEKSRSSRRSLILCGHGVKLRIDRGTLFVQNGFTHYPQKRETWRFFPGDWRLPSRIVVLDVDGSLSFDVLSWLSAHDIPLVHLNWRGDVVNVVGAIPTIAAPELVAAQRAAVSNGKGALIAQALIAQKIANSIETLRSLSQSPTVETAISKLVASHQQLVQNTPIERDRLKGVEGGVAYHYFRATSSLPVRWGGLDRHPIPDDWHTVGWRKSKMGSVPRPNRNATHPVQAMLNYAYGVLESEVRTQIVAASLDPTIGILHGYYEDKLPLVYDLMEPLRPMVNQRILAFVTENVFVPTDFVISETGSVRLQPQLARRIVTLVNVTDEVLQITESFKAEVVSSTK
jgi:CRISPR-associated protein Cas1